MIHRYLPGALALMFVADLATAQWTQTNASPRPWARSNAQIAHDTARNRTILFGGNFGSGSLLADTWSYDGVTWTEIRPTVRPLGRANSQLVFDSSRNVMVMYGGAMGAGGWGGSVPNGETWEWNGSAWARIMPAASPGNLAGHAMCFDSVRNRTVLFGGASSLGLPTIPVAGTWEYDGVTWRYVGVALTPGARYGTSMAFHPGIGKSVLFGGVDVNGMGMTGTWFWDGTAWTRWLVTSVQPTTRFAPEMAYDSARGYVVMHGGRDYQTGLTLTDTWAFDGANWRMLDNGTVPTYGGALAFDAARRVMILVGGATSAGNSDVVWEYGPSYTEFGAGCAGSAGVPHLSSTLVPLPGSNFTATITNLSQQAGAALMILGFSDTFGGFGPLPVSLTPLGMTNCTLYVDPYTNFTVLSSGGAANFVLPIPADPGLIGLEFFNQVIVPSPGSNPAGFVLSNPARGVIGV